MAPDSLLAQPQAKAPPVASASQQGAEQNPCDGFFHVLHFYPILSNNKVTLLQFPSPSDPGYGSKPEQLLNKMSWIEGIGFHPSNTGRVSVGTGVRISQNEAIACPLSLQGLVPPLPFQAIATPSAQDTQSGTSFPKGNYPTAHWPTGPYLIYRIHYSIAPKDLKLYSQKFTLSGSTAVESNYQMGSEDIPWRYSMEFGVGFFEFTTELYDNNGAIVNSTDATVVIRVAPDKAKQMLQSGVGLDQTIAVPASGTFRLRTVVTDTASQEGSEMQLTIDAAKPALLETLPVRPTPTSK
jgi:hypothetical protein